MRAGEICGLRAQDITGRVAHLEKTKNGHARNVPLSSRALEILAQLPKGEATLFNVPSASMDALFRKAKARAMIDDLHFHDSRREALSRMAKKVDVLTLAKISGHRDLRILSNVYYQTDMGEVAGLLD
jgi:integrase